MAGIGTRCRAWVATAVLVLGAPTVAPAAFHLALIDELMSGVGANADVQYVEIRMTAAFQTAVACTRLTAFNCDGSVAKVLLVVPTAVPNSGANLRWIMASPSGAAFLAASGINADFTWDDTATGSIDPTCGMVCWGAPGFFIDTAPGANCAGGTPNWNAADPNQYTDCVAYGGYTGTRKTAAGFAGGPTSGTPTTLAAGDGTMSLTRTRATNDNLADFALSCPTPTNNAGMIGEFGTCTPPTTTTTITSATTTTTTTLPAGTPLPISGKKLLLKDDAADPAKRKLLVVSHDSAINLGAGNGSADDPTVGGGSVRVRTAAGCGTGGTQPCDDTYSLPARSWKLIGKAGQNKGYAYKDPALANGPIRGATVKAKAHTVLVAGKGSGLGGGVAADPTSVDLVLTLGAKRYCMHFGGTEKLKVGKKATFQNAASPSACPP